MSILFNKLFTPIAFSHLLIDSMNGSRGILLAYLSVPLALSNTAVGLVSSLYQIAAALVQPFTGWLADRIGPRWLVAGGVLWMGGFFALALLIPGKLALAFLVMASFGSGMFHPAGSMQSTLLGRTQGAGHDGTAASFFFFFGQSGYFFGPLLGGPLLDVWGPAGLMVFVILCLPVSILGGVQLKERVSLLDVLNSDLGKNQPSILNVLKHQWKAVAVLLVIATCQSWIQQNMQTFVPKYLVDLGEPPSAYGFLAAVYMGGSALGNIFGGFFADRIGRRRVIIVSLALLSLPLFLITRVGLSPWLYVLIPVSGLFSGAAYTTIFVTSQRMVPGAMGLAAGIILSFMFSSGSVGALATGVVADRFGFLPTFSLSAGLAVLGFLFALGLKSDRLEQVSNLEVGYSED